MKRFGIAMLAAAGLVLAASSAQAQASFGLGLGLTMPMGDYGDVGSMGFHAQGSASFGLGAAPIGLRADLAYHRTGLEQGADGSTSLMGGMVHGVYNIPSKGQIRPYLLLGVGYFSEKVDVTGVGSADDNGLAYGAGVGLNFKLPAAALFVELKYTTIAENDTFAATNFLPITFGIRFGGK